MFEGRKDVNSFVGTDRVDDSCPSQGSNSCKELTIYVIESMDKLRQMNEGLNSFVFVSPNKFGVLENKEVLSESTILPVGEKCLFSDHIRKFG